jgi:predicted ATPase/transcriptional regulator with XRE-family HTH domain
MLYEDHPIGLQERGIAAMSFGEYLRRYRERAGMTQEELAAQAGLTAKAISALERAERRSPYPQTVRALADALGLSQEERAKLLQARIGSKQEAVAPQPASPASLGRAASTPPESKLPVYLTPFIGREQARAGLVRLLATPDCRLITLLGIGGIGKTRLAVEVVQHCNQFADGVTFVPLAPTSEPQAVVPAIAEALGLNFSGASDLTTQLLDQIRDKHMLLLLDSLEHLLSSAALPRMLDILLREAPMLSIVATSRERLRLSGEWVVELGGLDVPPDLVDGEIDRLESVALFVERARHLQGELALTPANRAAIAKICRLLEGIPLAIELAATWVRTLSCEEIAAEIGRSLDFLSLADHDQPATHQSMRAVFERSWSLLPADHQQVLARLSLFRGGCTREAAAFVAGASLPQIAALVQKSLVRRVGDHFELHDVIRRFGAEKLAAMPDAEARQQRFVEYYLALSVQASQQFADYGQRELFDALVPGLDNLRAIMRQAHRSSRQAEQGARICNALRIFWALKGSLREGAAQAERFLADTSLPADVRGDLYITVGHLARLLGDLPRARQAAEQAIVAHRSAAIPDEEGLAWAVSSLGRALLDEGDYAQACELYEECVALRRSSSRPHTLAWGLIYLGLVKMLVGSESSAREHFDEALRSAQQTNDRFTEGGVYNFLGLGLTLVQNREGRASAWRAVQLLHEQGFTLGMTTALEVLAAQAGLHARHVEAAQLVGAAQAQRGAIGNTATTIHRADYNRLFDMVQGPLDEASFAAACAAGRALTIEQVLALAERVSTGD